MIDINLYKTMHDCRKCDLLVIIFILSVNIFFSSCCTNVLKRFLQFFPPLMLFTLGFVQAVISQCDVGRNSFLDVLAHMLNIPFIKSDPCRVSPANYSSFVNHICCFPCD